MFRHDMQALQNESNVSMLEVISKSTPQSFVDYIPVIISLVSDSNNDVKEWGIKLTELLEDIVYIIIIQNNAFDIDLLFKMN